MLLSLFSAPLPLDRFTFVLGTRRPPPLHLCSRRPSLSALLLFSAPLLAPLQPFICSRRPSLHLCGPFFDLGAILSFALSPLLATGSYDSTVKITYLSPIPLKTCTDCGTADACVSCLSSTALHPCAQPPFVLSRPLYRSIGRPSFSCAPLMLAKLVHKVLMFLFASVKLNLL